MMNHQNWLIPFKGNNHSGTYNLNFLWKENSTYVMDNHRVALWCWFQHVDLSKNYNLLHIDRHSDTIYSQIESWKNALPANFHESSLDEYLEFQYEGISGRVPVLRWDNYLSLFLELYPNVLKKIILTTHGDGDPPIWSGNIVHASLWDILENIDYWLREGAWIVNIDIDYFFCDSDSENQIIMVSQDYLSELFGKIYELQCNHKIEVLTLSLSPDFSGGWESSKKNCKEIAEILKLSFSIP